MPGHNDDLEDLVKQKVENLRPKLLDLSRRNPLIATKLGPRSNAHIRVVDELPDVLFFKLNNGQSMRIVPLPDIDEDPRDERSDAFREALINARLIDEQYLEEMEGVERDADDYFDRTRAIERALKDRVREALGLPPRIKKTEINLVQHARINGIRPAYDLPKPDAEHEDTCHQDDDIQTLLLPSDLERKLNSVVSKCRTWVQETGMNVLHVAYGFLEWSDGVQEETSFAPLILCEAEIEKRRTSEGVEFWISGAGDGPEVNTVLAEMLRRNFSLELPKFEGSSVEEYFGEVARLSPKKLTWRVRRQVAMGVFPSARMAMYYDLDPYEPRFPKNEIVELLLAGSNSDSDSPFADEYDVDRPEVERKVPCIVLDADSSQFSTLVDLASGKNLAVEGPPGTGKSQTIVNAIAAALAEGKKVIFVAEKQAALNVVKSRLEAVGLGEFLLPLQADRATREQVIASIRERVEMKGVQPVHGYNEKVEEFRRVRNELAKYIDLIKQPFKNTGFTVHDILGKSINTNDRLASISAETLERTAVDLDALEAGMLAQLRQLGTRIEKAHLEASHAADHWKSTKLINPERFTVEEACNLAKRASKLFAALADARAELARLGLAAETELDKLSDIEVLLGEAKQHLEDHPVELLIGLLEGDNAEIAERFIDRCEAHQATRSRLSETIADDINSDTQRIVSEIADLCARAKVSTLDLAGLEEELEDRKSFSTIARSIELTLRPLVEAEPEAADWELSDISKAHALIKSAGRLALLCRSAKLAELEAVQVLKKLCRDGQELQSQKSRLAETISFAVEVTPQALSECLVRLRTAGMFAIFSGSYRAAKHLYRSLAVDGKYGKRRAVKTLELLIAFRKGENEFNGHPDAVELFGPYFKNIDTKFEPFERLTKFYEETDALFVAPEKRSLRSFLWEAKWSSLETVPAIPPTDAKITYKDLQDRISNAENEIELLEEAYQGLKSRISIFVYPKSVAVGELFDLADQIRDFLNEQAELDSGKVVRNVFWKSFRGWRTSTDDLNLVVDWALRATKVNGPVSETLLFGKTDDVRQRINAVLEANEKAEEVLKRLCSVAEIVPGHFIDGRSSSEISERLAKASEDSDGLFSHAHFATALEDIEENGLLPLIAERMTQDNSLAGLAGQLEALAIRHLAKAVHKDVGSNLSQFRGSKLDELRQAIADQDKAIIELSRKQLRTRVHGAATPPRGNGVGKKSSWTQMALIENEISKKQRFISVRDLTQRAGRALLELKPCWMMSPLAVAQYVPKEAIHFDLCIIDEASQMPPESAIGALLRSDQTMVVGDTNQLPPSSFFKKMIDDEEVDEDENVLSESILELANASFRPARRLRWHYRSRHSGLIKFSNRLVYDDDLIVFPSATESLSRMGVDFHAVSGLYKAGTNPIEAKTVVDAAVEFMHTDPTRSLGIVTLNQKQRDLISEEFDYAIKNDPRAQKYIDFWKEEKDGLEEFFIKNLENVQGDERDVIYIGTVYGPEEPGARVMQRFGPINGIAGKRRLNVLFSRAKQKIVTFFSMTSADIVADENGNPGTYLLKRWLEYSVTGVLGGGKETTHGPDSDFELFVIDQIKAMGCEPVPQVGVAGYFIDIGIRHPQWPHGFVLGVECDGASYHSAKSARDRDRLRQEVLEGLGWRLHRIWSTDWFNNPQREADKLRKLLDERLNELKAREAEFVSPAADASTKTVKSEQDQSKAETGMPLFADRQAELAVALDSIAPTQGDTPSNDNAIAVGDTVRVRYLNDDRKILHITISLKQSDPSQGIIHYQTPIAKALLGAEEGDEVEVLVGSYVRPAIVESIMKNIS